MDSSLEVLKLGKHFYVSGFTVACDNPFSDLYSEAINSRPLCEYSPELQNFFIGGYIEGLRYLLNNPMEYKKLKKTFRKSKTRR